MNKFNNRLFENLLHTNDLLSNKDEIPIHFLVVYGGYLCTIFTCCFCIIVGTSLPKTYDENQLFYISEGFQEYCGWSIVVLGTCTGITLFTQLISAVHMNQKNILFIFVFFEYFGWYGVLGISDTGWTIHYIALFFFLFGNVGFHWYASRDPVYGSTYYKATNQLTLLFVLLFGILNRISDLNKDNYTTKNFSVSIEYILCLFIGIQQLFLLKSLDQFEYIHILYVKRNANEGL